MHWVLGLDLSTQSLKGVLVPIDPSTKQVIGDPSDCKEVSVSFDTSFGQIYGYLFPREIVPISI